MAKVKVTYTLHRTEILEIDDEDLFDEKGGMAWEAIEDELWFKLDVHYDLVPYDWDPEINDAMVVKSADT